MLLPDHDLLIFAQATAPGTTPGGLDWGGLPLAIQIAALVGASAAGAVVTFLGFKNKTSVAPVDSPKPQALQAFYDSPEVLKRIEENRVEMRAIRADTQALRELILGVATSSVEKINKEIRDARHGLINEFQKVTNVVEDESGKIRELQRKVSEDQQRGRADNVKDINTRIEDLHRLIARIEAREQANKRNR